MNDKIKKYMILNNEYEILSKNNPRLSGRDFDSSTHLLRMSKWFFCFFLSLFALSLFSIYINDYSFFDTVSYIPNNLDIVKTTGNLLVIFVPISTLVFNLFFIEKGSHHDNVKDRFVFSSFLVVLSLISFISFISLLSTCFWVFFHLIYRIDLFFISLPQNKDKFEKIKKIENELEKIIISIENDSAAVEDLFQFNYKEQEKKELLDFRKHLYQKLTHKITEEELVSLISLKHSNKVIINE